MDETKKLAQFVVGVKYDDIPTEVVEKAKTIILDQLGCELLGSTLPFGRATYKFVRDNRGIREESIMVNYGLKTLAQDAAFANASFGRSVESDDSHPAVGAHLGSTIIPTAMAVGQKEMIGGKDLIRAIVMAYEVAARIGLATKLPKERGLYATTIFGPFGAATAAGLILGLDETGLQNAIGIAATHSSGIQEYTVTGGLVNRVHGGISAYGGIRAALLAQRGFTGPSAALEGKKGFFHSFSEKASPEDVNKPAKSFMITGIKLRPNVCCCGRQNAGLDAISKLAVEHAIRPQDVDKVKVQCSSELVEHLGHIKEPKDITNAQFCGRFGLALRLVKGGNGFQQVYHEENLTDPEMLRLMKRIDYEADDSLSKIPNSASPMKVTVRMKDGATYEELCPASKGTAFNPLTREERLDKFRQFASTALPEHKVEKVIETVESLEKLDSVYILGQLLVAD